jgi:hypothetical protein
VIQLAPSSVAAGAGCLHEVSGVTTQASNTSQTQERISLQGFPKHERGSLQANAGSVSSIETSFYYVHPITVTPWILDQCSQ